MGRLLRSTKGVGAESHRVTGWRRVAGSRSREGAEAGQAWRGAVTWWQAWCSDGVAGLLSNLYRWVGGVGFW